MGAVEDKMISVIMSCHNSNQVYLKESVESILNQTYEDFELLVADNEVQFDLKKFLKRFNDSRIKYIDNGGNIGPTASYDKLACMAKGKYVAIQDHDDISKLRRLELEALVLDAMPEIQSVSCGIHIFGCKKERNECEIMNSEQVKQELIFWQPIKQPTWMKRKEFCNQYRYGDRFMIYDFEFWSRTRKVPHYILGSVLLNYRRSYLNSSEQRTQQIRSEHAMIVRRNLHEIGIDASLELCQGLDPYNHAGVKSQTVDEFVSYKDKLLKEISESLYQRKLLELLKKGAIYG